MAITQRKPKYIHRLQDYFGQKRTIHRFSSSFSIILRMGCDIICQIRQIYLGYFCRNSKNASKKDGSLFVCDLLHRITQTPSAKVLHKAP